jgi:hypothetical protein
MVLDSKSRFNQYHNPKFMPLAYDAQMKICYSWIKSNFNTILL